jgi:hypothetical protein
MSLPFASRPLLVAVLTVFAECVVLAVAAPALAQEGVPASYRFVSLRVTDERTQAPLPAVRVTVQGVGDRDWSTDEQGRVLVAVVRGARAVLQLRRPGYAPRTINSDAGGDGAVVPIVMTPSVQTLDTTKVVGDATSTMLAGFEGRRLRRNGTATFITREQIEKQLAIRTIDVVRRAIGTKVIDSSGVLLVASSRGPKTIISAAKSDLAPCVMRVAVDGVMREWGFSLDGIEPKEIHGVEVYPGPATIPAEFGGMRRDAYCGLVMIWTRRGP